MAFVKLDCGILNSTLWVNREQRELFITALLMAHPFEITEPIQQIEVRTLEYTDFVIPPGWYGFVPAAGVGIIRRAQADETLGLLALEALGAPDKESRSPEFEGRRLVRIDGGYLILNFQKYREKDYSASERSKRYRERKISKAKTDTTAFCDEWQALVSYYCGLCAYCGKAPWVDIDHILPTSKGGLHDIKNVVPACKSCNSSKKDSVDFDKWRPIKAHPFSVTRDDCLQRVTTRSVTQAEAEVEVIDQETCRTGKPDSTHCPHEDIVKLYHQELPELNQVRVWSDARKSLLARSWKADKERQSLEWWKSYFAYVKTNPFLMGQKTDFQADLEFLVKPANVIKVIEGKYEK